MDRDITSILIGKTVLFETDIQNLSKWDMLVLWRWVVNEAFARARRGEFEPESSSEAA